MVEAQQAKRAEDAAQTLLNDAQCTIEQESQRAQRLEELHTTTALAEVQTLKAQAIQAGTAHEPTTNSTREIPVWRLRSKH